MDAAMLSYNRLEKALCDDRLDDEAMGPSEFDGFCAGLVISPTLIPPSEWLAEVGDMSAFGADAKAMDDLNTRLIEHRESVSRAFETTEGFWPLLTVAQIGAVEDTLWWLWTAGFHRAYQLRPENWRLFDGAGQAAREAKRDILRLCDYAERPGAPAHRLVDEVEEDPEAMLADIANTLYAARLNAEEAGRKMVGRNDPCPCGSGKKYKKCCLA